MKRLSVLALLLVLAVVGRPVLLGPDSAGAMAPDPTTITKYLADFDIDGNGDLSATETLTVDFPSGEDLHGIYRVFDKRDPSAPDVQRVPRHIDVTMDGAPVHFEKRSARHGRYVVVRIGDPDEFVTSGEHVYEISYEIDDVLEEGTTGQPTQFYWNLIPGGWLQRIRTSDLTVHLPVAAETLECAIGSGERSRDCRAAHGEGTDTITVHTSALRPRTPVTIRAGLDMPTPPQSRR